MTIRIPATIAAMLAASGAMAGEIAPGVEGTGYAELAYDFDSNAYDELRLEGDFDISIGPDALNMGAPIGIDFGIDGVWIDTFDSKVIYAAVSYEMAGFGKVSAGIPRSAFDSYVRSQQGATVGQSGSLAELAFGSANFFYAAALDDNPVGVRLDGEAGALSFAASFSRISDLSANTIALGAAFDTGQFRVEGAFENLYDNSIDFTNLKLGASMDTGVFAMGASYADRDELAFVGASARAVEIYGIFRPTEQIDVSASYVDVHHVFGDAYSTTLAAKYRFTPNFYGEATVTDYSQWASNLWQIAAGWQF